MLKEQLGDDLNINELWDQVQKNREDSRTDPSNRLQKDPGRQAKVDQRRILETTKR